MSKRTFLSTLTSLAAGIILITQNSSAAPYASCITNNAGTIQFYLNEPGGNVVVTYEDGSTNANFNGVTTGLSVANGLQSFSLAGHTSYAISVTKVGTGSAKVITTKPYGTPRGIDVNKNPASPYFGNVYACAASAAAPTAALWRLNSDLTGISTNSGGVAWTVSSSEPYRLAVNDDDYLTVGSWASAHSGVWRVDPTLSSNQLLLGPVGQTAGYAAESQGDQFSRPLLIGNLQSGGAATLLTVDSGSIPGVNAGQLNSVLVYSNLTLANLPRTNAPDLLGPEVCLNLVLNNNYPGITAGPVGQQPTRYIYCSNRRDGPATIGSPTVQIYALTNLVANTAGGPTNASGPGVDLNDPTTVGCVWDSYINVTAQTDYFDQDGVGPADSAVSPDGKYFCVLGYGNNSIKVVSLTNGIPNVSTLFTITNTVSTTSAGRGICWDAADNIYVSSSGGATFQEWTLGFTATAVTTGNASGPTGFSMALPSQQVAVYGTNSTGATDSSGNYLFSQLNSYGNPTNATFVITRSGSTSAPLTVFFTYGGSAASGTYTTTAASSVTIATGQASTNITITAVNGGAARPTTTITLNLSQSGLYTAVSPGLASLSLLNTATPQIIASVGAPTMYNAFSNDYSSFVLTRWGDINASAFTVSGYTYAGTAVAGMDYTLPTSITFNPGDISYTNYISPLNNGNLPVDSSVNTYVGNKTIQVSVSSGTGFTGSTNIAAITILDSANPTTTVLFSDPLTDPADAAHWAITAGNNNMQTNAIDNNIIFGYDLQNGDPGDYGAIPLPPSGASTALRVTVNKSPSTGTGAAAGVNLYPTNVSFSGNYAVRFNMNIVEGLSATASTEGPLFGINHSARQTNWFSSSPLLSGFGSTAPGSEVWSADGVWYWVNADNDYSGGAYLEFTGLGGTNNNTGWTQPSTKLASTFANAFKTNVFSGGIYWGPGLVSSGSILNGYTANNWADVEIKQLNNLVTLSINKTQVFEYTNQTVWTNGTLMLGYNDPFSSVGSSDGAVYFSNLRVVSLASPFISQVLLNKVNGTAVINFTSVDGDAVASSFVLQSASSVKGPYADVTSATLTQLSAGAFQAVVPINGSMQFYRIRQK